MARNTQALMKLSGEQNVKQMFCKVVDALAVEMPKKALNLTQTPPSRLETELSVA